MNKTKSESSLSEQDAQLSQRDRAAGCVMILAKSGIMERRGNILRIL